MSLDLDISDQTTAGTDIIMEAFFGLQQIFAEEKADSQLTQQVVADRLGLKNKSVVNRWLSGRENMTLRALGELAWALNRRARIIFERSHSDFTNVTPAHLNIGDLVEFDNSTDGVRPEKYSSVSSIVARGNA